MSSSRTKARTARNPPGIGDRRRPTEQRQSELIAAALRILETRGIAALSTRALAGEVGLTTGAIFRHFPSLDALLDAVVGRVENLLDATYPADELEPSARLMRFIELRSTAVGSERGILRLMLSEQFALALPVSGAQRLARCVERTRAFIVTSVREGQRLGTIRSDVEAMVLSVIVVGVIQALALSHGGPFSIPGRNGTSRVREGLAQLLVAPPAPPRAKPKRSRTSRAAAARATSGRAVT